MAPDGSYSDPFTPLTTMMLPVGDGHALYVETIGRADGIPAVYLHGGPGSGCQPSHRRLFDPGQFRAVLFDQRGAGRSTPRRGRTANTTAHLIADMELIRQTLGIDKWLVVGGSWGATLALAYAEAHPERVSGLVLRATFLGTRAELEWAFGTGLATTYPGLYQDFLSVLPEGERAQPLDAYWRRILDPDPVIHGPAARAWNDTERILSEVAPAASRLNFESIGNPATPLASSPFMEAYYFSHDCFMEPGQLLKSAGNLAEIPGKIVQGRFDLLCPPATSFALAQKWPGCEIRVVERAGHSLGDPGVTEAVVAAIGAFVGPLSSA
ncbi:proline iminopeptidase [Youhaiella tibetensis]|uniref:Proline iminopeptidase n=1 Tax=Paradevosia tibetensis TaxID=1447062 RepID=A0A5B9DLA6_9HYPH|nr:prolyl aminopeptidase [Youhaiella tibetensis]AKR54819.1 Proline iminopeptidase [Devosia sp. H5989]QEE19937.1 prolyl aminopeptidase [Youhaiella tibetensis]GGF28526.1 proline iminopeptidase [Youhaiella tibetensis]